ncbi:hypothetical protein [Halostagnicola sp. A-GB9-2]|uniref:hypothetical protein n=1 Tax=Halostagnicola sp. A-GB9-2 TaxID=3048066 RepID=UPI0024C0D566|nr:hypothetical protein [Halostagnicola sp. A-GB9-2]MDJ1433440.1 hypothetical protein [Halostagnicola sp. A-GB9-2]
MSRPSRRHVIAGSIGLVALTAGCLDNGGLASSPDSTAENEIGSNDGDNGTEDDQDDDPFEFEPVGFRHPDRPETPEADLLRTEADAEDWAEERGLEADEDVSAFIAETDFDGSRVLSLEGGATDLCYEMVLETVELDDETVTIRGYVTDEETDGDMCAQQITAVGALVRATVDDEQPSSFSVTITDADGREYGTGIATDSASDEGSETGDEGYFGSATGSDQAGGNTTSSERDDSS